jgi:hypothetical protein
MRANKVLFFHVRTLALAFALAGTGGPTVAEEAAGGNARGAAIVVEFKREMQTALRAGLEQGLPQSIAACQVRAPEIAQSLTGEGVRVGRTSHRLRNPANVAPDWVAPALDGYLQNPEDRAAKTVALDNNRVGYVEPIITQALCINCHGEEIARDVAESIHMLYPADRATGFRIGELRGVFWVEYPAQARAKEAR